MGFLINNGINIILAIQGLGEWLHEPMLFFTSLGYERFYMLILPLLYWSVDSSLGLRVGLILIVSNGINYMVKFGFAGPRPYWISTAVRAYSLEASFGIPSGHAQNAVSVWGMMAAYIRKPWAWIVAVVLMLLIGVSRMYLGVHFPLDVLAGWLIGAVTLIFFLGLWDRVAARVKKMSFVHQVFLAFGISLIMLLIGGVLVYGMRGFQIPAQWIVNALLAGERPDPISLDSIFTSAGMLFGLCIGAGWMMQRGGFQAEGPVWKRALRYLLGMLGVIILWMGLGSLFPRQEALIPYLLRYVRYTLTGFWVTGVAPWLFFHFNL